MTFPNEIQDQDPQLAGDSGISSGMRPETADFLNDLAGIGTGAFMDMRQADTPEYEDWRDGNFRAAGPGNYVSREGQTYTDDELERMHGVLSQEAGNPLISQLFDGPKSPWADYLAWRNQNYNNQNAVGGAWEDDDGTLYSEPALQQMFGMKFAAQPGSASSQTPSGATQSGQPGDQSSSFADSLKRTADYMQWRDQNFRQRSDGSWEGPDARIYTYKDLQAIYEIRQKKWPQQQAQTAMAAGGKDPTVTLIYANGMRERRTGNHPQRDNNPGNIEAGDFTDSHGAIGKDKGFGVFPTPEAGWAALDADLRTSKYQAKSIDDAIAAYAPPYGKNGKFLNDTPKYQASVRAALGVSGNTKLSALTPQQFEMLKQTIAQIEGFYDKNPRRKVKVIVTPPNLPNVIPRN
jgi:hypothetical protein